MQNLPKNLINVSNDYLISASFCFCETEEVGIYDSCIMEKYNKGYKKQ